MKTIAIVGVTGLVGEKLLSVLENNRYRANYLLFASSKSAQSKIEFMQEKHVVRDVASCYDCKADYALFMSTNDVAKNYAPIFVGNGATVIDNSSFFRMHEDVPLVVDQINGNLCKNSKLIANPNCTTIQLAIVLNALKSFGLKRVVASTYQSVSGAGKAALEDLNFRTSYGNLRGSLHPLFDNVVPQIDEFMPDGFTKEEMKVVNETRKILGLPNLAINCFAVRVPVTVGHGIFANVELENDFTLDEIRTALRGTQNVIVADDIRHNIYPMPLIARNTHYVYVGRLTKDSSRKNTLNCFIVADNLLRGASYNAFEILRRIESDE